MLLLLSPLGLGHGPLFEKKTNSLYTKMFCANWPSGSGENVESLQTDK